MPNLNATPSANRVHIGFFGRRNAGKSSIVNAVTAQDLAVVSNVAGTTTDPVQKAMELLPLGPVVIIDTPGFDDEGLLGEKRVLRTKQTLNRTDVAVLVVDASYGMGEVERQLVSLFAEKLIPYVVVYNKCDLLVERPEASTNDLYASALTGEGIHELKERLGALAPKEDPNHRLLADLISPGDAVVLVCPIDESAPKGRLILPQQMAVRDVLDAGATALVCRETELEETLAHLSAPPALVVTDSQAFAVVAPIVPDEVPLTSFSILMARYKGFLSTAVAGVAAVEHLRDDDVVLMAEGCTHHRQCNDIGTVKIPRWLAAHTGSTLRIETCSGREFPDDLSPYSLVIHCGGCMTSEREVQYRMRCATDQGVPFANYGITIAQMTGTLERSVRMFPEIHELVAPTPPCVPSAPSNTTLEALVEKLAHEHTLSDDEYRALIDGRTPELAERLAELARAAREPIYGTSVFTRGLIEISNICKNDCLYCGIRRSNHNAQRYRLDANTIVDCAREGYDLGFRTIVLQGGEDGYYTDDVLARIVERIVEACPNTAVTLSMGERSRESYQRLFDAGATRYLLRHETATREHYERLHPPAMSWDHRMQCLRDLREIGYQVGAGFMVGSPFQTTDHLVAEMRFVEEFRPDMCGIGPFIPHHDTQFAHEPAGTLELTLYLLSMIRLVHPHVLLPATTALGTIDPRGREKGMLAGANVVMPNLSPVGVRKNYELYDNKICTGEDSAICRGCLARRMASVGHELVVDRGDIRL